jgi:hypothetical protein
VLVFVDDATQAVASADGEVRDRGWIGDRIEQRLQRADVRDAAVGSVSVVVLDGDASR